jgi:hypothetical protein
MDPTGDPKYSLGANTFPEQKKAESQMLELQIQRDRTKTDVYQRAYRLAQDYNEAIQTYYQISQEIDTHTTFFNNLIQDALSSKPVHVGNIQWVAQKYGASLVAKHVTMANFRTARAKKDRILLSGIFLQLLPRLEQGFTHYKNAKVAQEKATKTKGFCPLLQQ